MGRSKFEAFKNKDNGFYAAAIMGTNYLERFSPEGPEAFHMILTHIVKEDEKYTRFFADQEGLKLLDNSLFELKYALPAEDILKAAELVDADILVAPDVIHDGQKTVENAIAFVEKLKELGKLEDYAVMAVPQGDSINEWIDCYSQLVAIEGVDCIGLSIIGMITAMQDATGTDDIVVNRTEFVRILVARDVIDESKWHHLLGLGRGPFELKEYASLSWIRSNDSSNAWWHGYNGVSYNLEGRLDSKLTSEVDFNAPYTNDTWESVVYNLSKLDSIVIDINLERGALSDTES